MVSSDGENGQHPYAVEPMEEAKAPSLPPDYFLELIDAPACRTKGYCDNCGRCEY